MNHLLVSRYCAMLDEYDALLDGEWWDGRREALVSRMDPVWKRMDNPKDEDEIGPERRMCLDYCEHLWKKRTCR